MSKYRIRIAVLAIAGVGLYYLAESQAALTIYCFMMIMDEINKGK